MSVKPIWNDALRVEHSEPLRIHLIGVAGSGMSGLASLLLGLGYDVHGSDRLHSKEIERLERAGLGFCNEQTAESIGDAQLVIYSSAVKPGNPAYDAAVERGIPLLRRAEALADILARKRGIVVAGTHGKTTTSALSAHVLRGGELDPSHYVGAEIPVLGTNAHWSAEGEYMVAEGDESDGTLTNFQPEHAILLNVEAEHLDYYSDGIEGIRRVFRQFLDQTSGTVFYCGQDPEATVLCKGRESAVSYGMRENGAFDFAAEVVAKRAASTDFKVYHSGKELGMVTLGIPGAHNILNALAVIALATELMVPFEKIAESLHSFRGAKRRFEVKYRSIHHTVIDDYGHHPTEIRATVQTALAQKPERLIVVFQPHRYSRTQLLRDEFGAAFEGADLVFVTDVYAASETPIPGISGQTIVDAVKERGQENVFSTPDLKTAHLEVGHQLREGDVILTLGAGNIHEVGTILARDLDILNRLRTEINEPESELKLYEPMSRHTTLKVGGPAQYWVSPRSVETFAICLRFFAKLDIPVRVIGRGSNLLVRDGGIAGAVIHPSKGEFEEVRTTGHKVIAGVGTRFKKMASAAKNAGIGGFEWMEGIPGSVGGGLRMNAGAMGVQTFDQVSCVTCLDREGNIFEKTADEFAYEYRNVPDLIETYAVQAEFSGSPADPAEIEQKMVESMHHRRSSQPVAASAGCTFKNPNECPAGKLVDELGMKGWREGAVCVSDVHGNFIVNEGGGSASDMLKLIDRIKAEALEKRGITLETEVQIIGQDQPYR
jgi:UDP-N-acetylmuramate--alanine ligase